MTYVYFTDLDIGHIHKDAINQKFNISKIRQAHEFFKSFIETYNQRDLQRLLKISDLDKSIYFSRLQTRLEFDLSILEKYTSVFKSEIIFNKELNNQETFKTDFNFLLQSFLIQNINILEQIGMTSILFILIRYSQQITQKLLNVIELEKSIYFSQLQRGLEFSLDSINSFNSNILSDIEFLDKLYQSSNYQSIFDLLSPSFLKSIPIITILVALTTLSFAQTKIFSPLILFDNFLSSVEDLTFSPHFQSDIESLVTSIISFDDIYSIWKIILLSFSKNINSEYNQIQDFGIDLNTAQLLSEIFILTPSAEEIRIALKEILILAKQIEVLAMSNQITVITTVKQISTATIIKQILIATTIKEILVVTTIKQIPISISTQMV